MSDWISCNYGTKKGFLKTYWYQFLYYIGFYRKYKNIDWVKVNRVIFVCKGNVCRSAYAEQVAKSYTKNCKSCGLEAKFNVGANQDAIKAAKTTKYSLDFHKTTPLDNMSFQDGDLLIAMEPYQIKKIANKYGYSIQYTLLGVWNKQKRPYIQDPYGCSEEYFSACFKYLQDCVHDIMTIYKNTQT